MITEDYVSFETAKLLKEKGFDSEEVGCYGGFYSETCYERGYGIITESGQEVGIVYDDLRNCDLDYNEYLRPTLQMAMKWLREKKQIFISIMFCDYPALQKSEWIPEVCTHDSVFDEPSIAYPTYEEACESAIKYCLENLI